MLHQEGGRDALLQLALLLLVRLPRLPQLLLGRADLLFPPSTRQPQRSATADALGCNASQERKRHGRQAAGAAPDWGASARGMGDDAFKDESRTRNERWRCTPQIQPRVLDAANDAPWRVVSPVACIRDE